uniref:ATPase AAA-type core domain-containing protein n=1 Tax=Anguilla anguilla TaxID=7936 RepID=A0A0E9QJ06_ANGAN
MRFVSLALFSGERGRAGKSTELGISQHGQIFLSLFAEGWRGGKKVRFVVSTNIPFRYIMHL